MTSPTGSLAALDAAHRARQAENSQRVAQSVLAYWLTRVSAEDLTGTVGPWLDFSVTQILRGYDRSYMIASAYTSAVQRIQVPGAPRIEILRPDPPPVEKLRRSLSFTGPGTVAVGLKKTPEEVVKERPTPEEQERQERAQATRGEQIKVLMEKAGAAAAASTYKNVANGGRATIDDLVVTRKVVGYTRITKDKPCGFCLMLASRGPVYQEDSFDESDARFTGPGDHKVHDTCGCMLRPEFTRDPKSWTESARVADDLWREMLRENGSPSGKRAVAAFRRLAKERGLADLTR